MPACISPIPLRDLFLKKSCPSSNEAYLSLIIKGRSTQMCRAMSLGHHSFNLQSLLKQECAETFWGAGVWGEQGHPQHPKKKKIHLQSNHSCVILKHALERHTEGKINHTVGSNTGTTCPKTPSPPTNTHIATCIFFFHNHTLN